MAHAHFSIPEAEARIREATNSDIDRVVSFHNQNHKDERTSHQWLWEYKSHHPDLAVFTVVEDGNRIVGTQGMIPIHLGFRGGTHLSGKSESSLLETEYRGGETFRKLYAFAMSLCRAKGMCCVWGLTTAGKVWREKLSFSVHDDAIYTSASALNLRLSLSGISGKRNTIDKVVAYVVTTLACLYASVRRRLFFYGKAAEEKRFSIEQVPRSYRDLDQLYERLTTKHTDLIYIRQDEDYLRWRIIDNPNVRYMSCFLYEQDLLQSYCYIGTGNRSAAYLTDFTFADDDAGAYLLQEVIERLRNRKVAQVTYLGNVKNPLIGTVFNLLNRCGFIKRRSPLAVVIKNITCEDEEAIHDIRNWYLNGLWTEGYTW
jgi:hypothetical protein